MNGLAFDNNGKIRPILGLRAQGVDHAYGWIEGRFRRKKAQQKPPSHSSLG